MADVAEKPDPKIALAGMAASIRTAAAIYPTIEFMMPSREALHLARTIERGLAPPPAPLQIARQDPAIDWVKPAFLCLVLIEAVHAFAPAAAAIAGLL